MSFSRQVLLTLAFAVATSCASDVVLATLRAPGADGGVTGDDGGAPRDGGGVIVDAGSGSGLDAGSDGGVDAGSRSDSGTPDGGSSDGGSDAGGQDAGSFDGGAPDASSVDLEVSFSTLHWVVELDAGTAPFNLVVRNVGSEDVTDAAVELLTPLGAQFQNTGACSVVDAGSSDAGRLVCPPVDLLAGGVFEQTIQVLLAPTLRSYVFVASVGGLGAEADLSDNTARFALAVTPPGVEPLPLLDGGILQMSFCAGTNITSYAQCVPGSRLVETFVFLPDGGWELDGMPMGRWAQGPHQRNLAFGNNGTAPGDLSATWVGATVDGGCFEGVFQTDDGRAYAGAWRGCP